MSRSPPLRFLVLLLAGWTGLRAAWLAPGWPTPPAEAGEAPAGRSGSATARSPEAGPLARPPVRAAAGPAPANRRPRPAPVPGAAPRLAAAPALPEAPTWGPPAWPLPPPDRNEHRAAAPLRPGSAASPGRAGARWSFAAWSFARRGDSAALAPGGILGGSQAGAVARFRLNGDPARPLALAVRLSSPLGRAAGAEAAVGVDWQPSRRIPVHVLAERRQALGREGRSAFGLAFHGGVSDSPVAGFRVDAYAQAGIVGTRSRDLFGDGALRLSLPLGRVRLGAGAWAAAQPGVARLDLGPQASLRLPLVGRHFLVAADWRFRVAGQARPGSGPALTVAADF